MRPVISITMLEIAHVMSNRSTCARRGVGAVITDRDNKIMSTGYNGVPSGTQHCSVNPCPAAGGAHGTALEHCRAVHAEQNALLQCPDVMKAHKLYVTCSPCLHCMKMIMNTGIKEIYFREKYKGHWSEVLELIKYNGDIQLIWMPTDDPSEAQIYDGFSLL